MAFLVSHSLLPLVTSVGKVSGNINLVFLALIELTKCFSEKWERKKRKRFALLARSKLNRIENILSKAPVDSDSSHEEIALVINKNKLP